jgi:DNA-binding CsgD family transcriptional regulator
MRPARGTVTIPAVLVGRLARTLAGEHAEHLVAPLTAALGPHLRIDDGDAVIDGRAVVEVSLVGQLVALLGPTRAHLLPGILTIAAPWLATAAPPASVELTDIERIALRHASHGRSNPVMARAMGYGEEGAKGILRRVYGKLGALDRAHAVRRGFETGVLVPEAGPAAIKAVGS